MTQKKISRQKRVLDAIEREQRKMAEEIHDTLCQSLGGVSLLVQVLLRHAKKGKPFDLGELKKIGRYLDEAIDEARLSFQDQTLLLGSADLTSALEHLAHQTNKRTACEFSANKPKLGLSGRLAYVLYRIAQEAVRNAQVHAQADQIKINLHGGRNKVSLCVQDDGRGFNPSMLRRSKVLHGLELMEIYAKSVDATLAIESRPGKETAITCVASIR
jgi:signal transduction histidine kinase